MHEFDLQLDAQLDCQTMEKEAWFLFIIRL